MNPIRVGLLGAGTVGSGTFNVLRRNQEEIQRRAGRAIEITMVADIDIARARAVARATGRTTTARRTGAGAGRTRT
jgi:homoserine dehydrogenase